jgi:thiamine pyrophosphokinase
MHFFTCLYYLIPRATRARNCKAGYCNKNITNEIHMACAICTDFELCLQVRMQHHATRSTLRANGGKCRFQHAWFHAHVRTLHHQQVTR